MSRNTGAYCTTTIFDLSADEHRFALDYIRKDVANHHCCFRCEGTPLVVEYFNAPASDFSSIDRQSLELFSLRASPRKQEPRIGPIVGWLDLESAQFEQQFASYRKTEKFIGICPMLPDLDDDAWI